MGSVYASSFRAIGGTAPFLKWAGGKQWLAARLIRFVSPTGTYYEPFLGGASLFFAARPRRAALSDKNADLIETYECLRDEPFQIIDRITEWSYNEETYYRVREMHPRSRVGRAARFIYLNRTCWNGLYRVNRNNQFNVPFGRFANPTICDASVLLGASRALQEVNLTVSDFEQAVEDAQRGDVVYLDPPYTVKHSNNGFLRYNEHLFTWSDQERLASLAHVLKRRGCRVLVTNACHKHLVSLYNGFHVTPLRRPSNLAGDPSRRGTETEMLISSFPLTDL
jgi:DNA adenine methylase